MTEDLTREAYVAAWEQRAELNRFAPSDEGMCAHGVPRAPGRADNGRSQWCGECYPDDES